MSEIKEYLEVKELMKEGPSCVIWRFLDNTKCLLFVFVDKMFFTYVQPRETGRSKDFFYLESCISSQKKRGGFGFGKRVRIDRLL